MGVVSAFRVTTSSAAPTTTLELPTVTITGTAANPVIAMVWAGVSIWYQRLEHPNECTIQATWNIAETGVNFTNSPTACDIWKINKGAKQPIHDDLGKTEITKRINLISADLLGPVTPAARGNYRFIAKNFDHYTKFKAA